MFGLVPFRRRNQDHPDRDLMNSVSDFFDDDFFAPMMKNFNTDIRETKDAYIIDAELPGFEKQDIAIDYANNYLTISATRKEDSEIEEKQYIRRERQSGELVRRFYLENIDEEKIKAKFKNGILEIQLPKVEKKIASN